MAGEVPTYSVLKWTRTCPNSPRITTTGPNSQRTTGPIARAAPTTDRSLATPTLRTPPTAARL